MSKNFLYSFSFNIKKKSYNRMVANLKTIFIKSETRLVFFDKGILLKMFFCKRFRQIFYTSVMSENCYTQQ